MLWQLTCEKFAADKVVRLGVTVLERRVAAARHGAETMRRLSAVLDGPGRALLIAFLCHVLEETTDEFIDLFDRCLARTAARAEQKLEEFRLVNARTTDEAIRLFSQTGRNVLDPTVVDRQALRRRRH